MNKDELLKKISTVQFEEFPNNRDSVEEKSFTNDLIEYMKDNLDIKRCTSIITQIKPYLKNENFDDIIYTYTESMNKIADRNKENFEKERDRRMKLSSQQAMIDTALTENQVMNIIQKRNEERIRVNGILNTFEEFKKEHPNGVPQMIDLSADSNTPLSLNAKAKKFLIRNKNGEIIEVDRDVILHMNRQKNEEDKNDVPEKKDTSINNNTNSFKLKDVKDDDGLIEI